MGPWEVDGVGASSGVCEGIGPAGGICKSEQAYVRTRPSPEQFYSALFSR